MAVIGDDSIRLPFERAVAGESDSVIFTGAITPHDPLSGVVPQGTGQVDPTARNLRFGYMFLDVPGDRAFAQAWQVYSNLTRVLSEHGGDITRLIRQRLFVRDLADLPVVERVMDHFLDRRATATTIVQIHGEGVDPEIIIQLEAVAAKIGPTGPRPVRDAALESVLGEYPAAVEFNELLFLSAVPGLNPDTGRVAIKIDEVDAHAELFDVSPYRSPRQRAILAQTWFTFLNMERVCRAADSDLGQILKVNGWLDFPMRDFDPTRPVREHFFARPESKVASTGLWVGPTSTSEALLAYDAVCLVGAAEKEIRLEPSLIVSYYVGATAGAGLVFTCGEVPIAEEIPQPVIRPSQFGDERRLAGFGRLEDLSGIEAQAAYVYDKLQHYLEAHSVGIDRVIYQTIYLRDVRLHSPLELVARSFFGGHVPATTTVPIRETSPFFPVVDLEIEVVASY